MKKLEAAAGYGLKKKGLVSGRRWIIRNDSVSPQSH